MSFWKTLKQYLTNTEECCGGNCCGGMCSDEDSGEENDSPEQIFKVTVTYLHNGEVKELITDEVYDFLMEEDENTGTLIIDLFFKDRTIKRLRFNRGLWISVVAE